MENKLVAPEDLINKLGKKRNLYDILKLDFGFYLPPYESCPVSFLKDIFAQKKKTLMHGEMSMIPTPRYKELGVKPVWELFKQCPDLLEYFPDLDNNQLPDRSFLWEILGSLRSEACKQLLEEARLARSTQAETNADELIEIHPDFLEKLMNIPTATKNKGRVAHILKKSTPSKIKRNKPREHPTNLRLLGMHSEEEKKKEEDVPERREANSEEDRMNVDIPRSFARRSRDQ